MIKVDANYNIELTRGDTGLFTIVLYDADGMQYVPDPACQLRFAMGKKFGLSYSDVLISRQIPVSTMRLEIRPEDTKNLAFGQYVYDIELTDEYDHVSTVVMAKFTITKEVY